MEDSQLQRVKAVLETIRVTNTRDRQWYEYMAARGLAIFAECEHSVRADACFACGSPASGGTVE